MSSSDPSSSSSFLSAGAASAAAGASPPEAAAGAAAAKASGLARYSLVWVVSSVLYRGDEMKRGGGMGGQKRRFVFWSAVKPDLGNLQWMERSVHQERGGH
jgi:hypothetical protein